MKPALKWSFALTSCQWVEHGDTQLMVRCLGDSRGYCHLLPNGKSEKGTPVSVAWAKIGLYRAPCLLLLDQVTNLASCYTVYEAYSVCQSRYNKWTIIVFIHFERADLRTSGKAQILCTWWEEHDQSIMCQTWWRQCYGPGMMPMEFIDGMVALRFMT